MGFSEQITGHRTTVKNDRIIGTIIALGSIVLVCWWQLRWGVYNCYSPGDRYFTQHHRQHAQGIRNPAYLIKAYQGAVASENELCSKMGVDVLRQGGNAVDAAISTTFCIGVVNMFS